MENQIQVVNNNNKNVIKIGILLSTQTILCKRVLWNITLMEPFQSSYYMIPLIEAIPVFG